MYRWRTSRISIGSKLSGFRISGRLMGQVIFRRASHFTLGRFCFGVWKRLQDGSDLLGRRKKKRKNEKWASFGCWMWGLLSAPKHTEVSGMRALRFIFCQQVQIFTDLFYYFFYIRRVRANFLEQRCDACRCHVRQRFLLSPIREREHRRAPTPNPHLTRYTVFPLIRLATQYQNKTSSRPR